MFGRVDSETGSTAEGINEKESITLSKQRLLGNAAGGVNDGTKGPLPGGTKGPPPGGSKGLPPGGLKLFPPGVTPKDIFQTTEDSLQTGTPTTNTPDRSTDTPDRTLSNEPTKLKYTAMHARKKKTFRAGSFSGSLEYTQMSKVVDGQPEENEPSDRKLVITTILKYPVNVTLIAVMLSFCATYAILLTKNVTILNQPWDLAYRPHLKSKVTNGIAVITSNDFCGRIIKTVLGRNTTAAEAASLMFLCLFMSEPHAVSPYAYNVMYHYNSSEQNLSRRMHMEQTNVFQRIYKDIGQSSLLKRKDSIGSALISVYGVRLHDYYGFMNDNDEHLDDAFVKAARHIRHNVLNRKKCNDKELRNSTQPSRIKLCLPPLRYATEEAFRDVKFFLKYTNDIWSTLMNQTEHTMDRSDLIDFLYTSFGEDNVTKEEKLRQKYQTLLRNLTDAKDLATNADLTSILQANLDTTVEIMMNESKSRANLNFMKIRQLGRLEGYWLEEQPINKDGDLELENGAIIWEQLSELLVKYVNKSKEDSTFVGPRPDDSMRTSFLIRDRFQSVVLGGGGLSSVFGAGLADNFGVVYDYDRNISDIVQSPFQPLVLLNEDKTLKSISLIATKNPSHATQLRTNLLLANMIDHKNLAGFEVPMFPFLLVKKTLQGYQCLHTAGYRRTMDPEEKESCANFKKIPWSDFGAEILHLNMEGENPIAVHVTQDSSAHSIFV